MKNNHTDAINLENNKIAVFTNELLKKKTNQLHVGTLLLVGLYALGYSLLDYTDRNWKELWIDLIIIPCIILAFYLIKSGQYFLSKVFAFLFITSFITLLSLINCKEMGIHFF